MSRKDFVLIASAIDSAAFLSADDRARLALHFARALSGTNGRFDVQRFINACTKSDNANQGGR